MSKIIVLCELFLFGVWLIVIYHRRDRRPYLLFFGLTLWAFGVALLLPKYQIIPFVVAGLALVLGIVFRIRAGYEDFRRYQEERQRNEAAMRDYLTAVTHQQAEASPTPPTDTTKE